MARRLKPAYIILLAVMAARGASAQSTRESITNTKIEDIRRLLQLTGAMKMADQFLDQMLIAHRQTLPQVPEAVWEETRRAIDTNEMLDIVVAVWERHFSQEDIRGLIAFHETPLGTKLVRAQPQILLESMTAGQEWAMRTSEKLKDRLRQTSPAPTQIHIVNDRYGTLGFRGEIGRFDVGSHYEYIARLTVVFDTAAEVNRTTAVRLTEAHLVASRPRAKDQSWEVLYGDTKSACVVSLPRLSGRVDCVASV